MSGLLLPGCFTHLLTHLLTHSLTHSRAYLLTQDDYILSFMLNVANITVRSIWNNFNVASHIEGNSLTHSLTHLLTHSLTYSLLYSGVSKSNSQMHMNSKVFEREQNTKDCLVYYTDMLYHTIIPGTISRSPTPSLEL